MQGLLAAASRMAMFGRSGLHRSLTRATVLRSVRHSTGAISQLGKRFYNRNFHQDINEKVRNLSVKLIS
jgi:hypothetical protein